MDKKTVTIMLGVLVLGGAGFMLWRQNNKTLAAPAANPAMPLLPNNPVQNIMTDVSLMVKSVTTLGEKNNNPLNIKWDANSRKDPWVGQIGEKGAFVVFKAPEYGFRAANRILNTYAGRGLNTIAAIVGAWAPASVDKNATRAYINYVASKMGKLEFSPITTADRPKLLQAMAKFETGKDWPMEWITKGIALTNSTV
jgi:hypothetical protein